ncbi:MAG TPA: phosphate ABC transporter ATP-binding protein PstB [Nitrospira sp.]|nr:phosphate ABC transporter ATP-binding protein PstB [Nitrospira sp.]
MTIHVDVMPAIKAESKALSFYYGGTVQALKSISLALPDRRATALIGPSGCGKTTYLRCLNRMHDLYPGNRYAGAVFLYPDGLNIVDQTIDPIEIRMRIGMVFQKPNPFPTTIYDNVAYGLRIRGSIPRSELDGIVEQSLKDAALWPEVKDRLRELAFNLSGGQQQRLCIARALATGPEMLLFDEPTSALDPTATARIEELVTDLKQRVTIVIVTHNMQQAARVSDYTAFMYEGELVECDRTEKIFTNPSNKLTEEYVTGRFG